MPPTQRDVVIRSRPTSTGTEFLVTLHDSSRAVAGPFATLPDAVAAAHTVNNSLHGAIWHEPTDHRGRALGLPVMIAIAGA